MGLAFNGLVTHMRNNASVCLPGLVAPKPEAIDIYPTFRCNLKCVHCNSWRHGKRIGELSSDTWQRIIDQLAAWLGPFRLRICGGEPLVRKDTVDLISHAHGLGLFTVLSTNGTLIDQAMARRIAKSGLDYVAVSLDSLRPERCDRWRGKEGVFDGTVRAIDLLRGRVPTVKVNTTIMKGNLGEIADIIDFCQDRGLRVSFQGLGGKNLGGGKFTTPSADPEWPDDEGAISDLFDALLAADIPALDDSRAYLERMRTYYLEPNRGQRESARRCQVFRRNYRILHNGDVTFCRHSGVVGNVAASRPDRVWCSSRAARVREELRLCNRSCGFFRSYYDYGLLEKAARFWASG